jgi:hypothetical protein
MTILNEILETCRHLETRTSISFQVNRTRVYNFGNVPKYLLSTLIRFMIILVQGLPLLVPVLSLDSIPLVRISDLDNPEAIKNTKVDQIFRPWRHTWLYHKEMFDNSSTCAQMHLKSEQYLSRTFQTNERKQLLCLFIRKATSPVLKFTDLSSQ